MYLKLLDREYNKMYTIPQHIVQSSRLPAIIL